MKNMGLIAFKRDTPALFIATSSYRSARFPKTMMEERRIAKGKAIGMRCMAK
jgi:hypothetical protein